MAKFILDGQEYGGGSSGSNIVKLTQAEYDALSNDKLSDDTIYLITDSGELAAENLFYDGSQTGLGNNVQGAIDKLNSNLGGVSFILNEDGTIAGYTSGGADTVHPFINKTKYDEILQTTKNLWRLEIANRCSNTLEAFAGQTVKSVKIIDDTMTATSWNITDYYTGKATTNVYVNSDINLSCKLSADDSGALYVNGNFIANAGTVTLPLKAGWNEVIVIYTDNTSYDGWVFNPKFSANSNIVEVNLHTHDI